jgi:hypothetical protein
VSVRFLRALRFEPSRDTLPTVKRASPAGKQLVALARQVEGLDPAHTGLYLAMGIERLDISLQIFRRLSDEGFDAVGPTAPLFHHTPYGPMVSVGLELGCRGPFEVFEGVDDSGLLALQQALGDLRAGRCKFALLLAWSPELEGTPGEAWMIALGSGDAAGLRWASAFGREATAVQGQLADRAKRPLEPTNPRPGLHAFGTLAHALEAAAGGAAVSVVLPSSGGRRSSGLALWREGP